MRNSVIIPTWLDVVVHVSAAVSVGKHSQKKKDLTLICLDFVNILSQIYLEYDVPFVNYD